MDAKEETAQLTAISSPSQSISYADRDVRISKENLYMVLALHMETFPVEREEEIGDYRKVGAVLVLPNDMIYAVDCSRNGVHVRCSQTVNGTPRYPARLQSFRVEKTMLLVYKASGSV